eukprot:CAMPEP_0172609216 /NCGR_PEP_ID=MMETSP1068-20121228/29233_1 /TAXON_ID=35684 /ORGANISM="Pseudopedinella elastica, Strain CCMP716" /LENGTH=205 /DNA_ID=CAMNT_0013412695 /DNA_START=97 /DNA_END=710 /DNA_ORIENTATION=+
MSENFKATLGLLLLLLAGALHRFVSPAGTPTAPYGSGVLPAASQFHPGRGGGGGGGGNPSYSGSAGMQSYDRAAYTPALSAVAGVRPGAPYHSMHQTAAAGEVEQRRSRLAALRQENEQLKRQQAAMLESLATPTLPGHQAAPYKSVPSSGAPGLRAGGPAAQHASWLHSPPGGQASGVAAAPRSGHAFGEQSRAVGGGGGGGGG